MNRRRIVLALAAGALVLPTAPAGAATVAAPVCVRVVPSTAFRTDHTAYCFAGLGYDYDQQRGSFFQSYGVQVWRTTNGGRTWESRSSFVTDQESRGGIGRLIDAWALADGDERGLYLATQYGLYVSTDGAKSYHLVDAHATPSNFHFGAYGFYEAPLTPFYGTFAPAPGTPKLTGTLFAYAGDDLPNAVIDAGNDVHAPVSGAGVGTIAFLLPPDFGKTGAGFALAGQAVNTPNSAPVSVETLYGCPAALACAQKLTTFPANRDVDGLWLAPDYASSHRILATHRPSIFGSNHFGDLAVVESTDGGATFHTWASADKLLAAARAAKADAEEFDLATGAYGNTLYARMVAMSPGTGWPSVPQYQIFRSTDAGRSWKRVAYLSVNRSKDVAPRGNLPFVPSTFAWNNEHSLSLTGDGTLFGTGTAPMGSDYHPYVWCSRDGGLHWSKGCKR